VLRLPTGLRLEDVLDNSTEVKRALELLEKCDPVEYELRTRRLMVFRTDRLPARATLVNISHQFVSCVAGSAFAVYVAHSARVRS
jgi:hypothetical protein